MLHVKRGVKGGETKTAVWTQTEAADILTVRGRKRSVTVIFLDSNPGEFGTSQK